ncbi:hypothetical protein V8F06_008581 [Rhypophila decipiens]
MASQPEIPLQYMDGLEPAPQNFPEVSRRESRAPELAYYYNQDAYHPGHPHHHPYPPQIYQPYHNLPLPPKPDDPYGSQIPLAGVGSAYPFSPNSQTAVLSQSGATIYKDSHKRILGCPRLVFFLSCAIALLSAAVISLAAMTGIETARASDFEKRAANLSIALASATSANPAATSTSDGNPQTTSFSVLTNGCSDDPEGTTGNSYTSFSLLGQQKYSMSCNKDTIHPPLLSLFTSNFQTCMDACSAYSKYMPGNFDPKGTNTTCVAVSFIPLWTVKQDAEDGFAPGNCYLKPGPMDLSDLKPANIGTECHSAVLVDQT